MELEKRRELLNSHLKQVSIWMRESNIDPNSNFGKEFLKQTRELIEQNHEIRELKEKTTQRLGRLQS